MSFYINWFIFETIVLGINIDSPRPYYVNYLNVFRQMSSQDIHE